MIWVFLIHSTSIEKNTESSIIFLQNDVLILNGKENKEIRILKKKNEELLWKVPSKNEVILLWKKVTKKIWFVNIFEYHHRTMGLM